MRFETNRTRDPFTVSRTRMAATNPYVVVPALPDGEIEDARKSGLPYAAPAVVQEDQPSTTRELENALARYFAPGRRLAA